MCIRITSGDYWTQDPNNSFSLEQQGMAMLRPEKLGIVYHQTSIENANPILDQGQGILCASDIPQGMNVSGVELRNQISMTTQDEGGHLENRSGIPAYPYLGFKSTGKRREKNVNVYIAVDTEAASTRVQNCDFPCRNSAPS